MSQPVREPSHESATDTGPGSSMRTKAHDKFGLWVEASGIDPGADTLEVRAEVSPNGEHYAPVDRGAPDVGDTLHIEQGDLVQSESDPDVYVAYVGSNSFPIDHIRANISAHSGGFEVDTYVYASGWTQRGMGFDANERL